MKKNDLQLAKPKAHSRKPLIIASIVAERVIIDYHRENKRLSFWDILIFLRRNGLVHIIAKKHNRDAFFRYMKTELEKCLGTPIKRDFNDKAGTTDNEYSNWFFKRSFCWGQGR